MLKKILVVLLVSATPCLAQRHAFDLQQSRANGIEAFPHSAVALDVQLWDVADHKPRVLVVSTLDIASSEHLRSLHLIVSPGETLYLRSPLSESEELHLRVDVADTDGESRFETVRAHGADILARSLIRAGAKIRLDRDRPAA